MTAMGRGCPDTGAIDIKTASNEGAEAGVLLPSPVSHFPIHVLPIRGSLSCLISRFLRSSPKLIKNVLDKILTDSICRSRNMNNREGDFWETLGYSEEPFGVFYTDTEPESGFVPKEGATFSNDMELRCELDFSALFQNWSCVMGNIWLARRRKSSVYFDARRFGCIGGSFYLGFHRPQLQFIAHYVSSGIPGRFEGERYLPSPEVTQRFFNELQPRPAPARFCVFKPLSMFRDSEAPEVVTFFARAEVMAGLCTLATFATEDFEAVMSPFGAGCSYIVTWPLHYLEQGRMKAVIGGWDPSDRKFMKPDEMTFSVPYQMYLLFLEKWEKSFLLTETWAGVKKKISKSRETWGEQVVK